MIEKEVHAGAVMRGKRKRKSPTRPKTGELAQYSDRIQALRYSSHHLLVVA